MSTHHVYCSCARDGMIVRFVLDDATGRLERNGALQLPDAQKPAISHPLALSRDGALLLAAVRIAPYRIITYAIDRADGWLTQRRTAPTAGNLAFLTLDATGRWLLGASLPDSLVVGHRIDPRDGVVGSPIQVIRDISKAHSIVIDAANRHAYIAALGEQCIRIMKFDATTGMLGAADTPRVALGSGAGPRHLAFDPRQRFLYCLNETDGTIDALARDADTGALTRVQTASLFDTGFRRPANVHAADLAMHPTGRFLYATERSSSTLATFALDRASGTMERVASIGTEATPRGIRMAPSGRWLLVAGEDTGHIAVHAIDAASGALEVVGRSHAWPGANWIVMTDGGG